MLRSIRLQHVRSHADTAVNFAPHVTVLHGINGAGKTSVLEAINLLYQGKSFRGSLRELVSYDQPWLRIDGQYERQSRTVIYKSFERKRSFTINATTRAILTKDQRLPIVLFEPDDLRIINGSPARRRQYLDLLIEQINPQYSILVRRYERILRQRNEILKQQSGLDLSNLFAWNISLAQYGAAIVSARQQIIVDIQQRLRSIYQSISHTNDILSIQYSLTEPLTSQTLLAQLEQAVARDQILGFTSIGPHRHDFQLQFNNQPAAVMSRGEIRTAVLALKFIELQVIEQQTGKRPLFLLDDVFGELDDQRKQNLSYTFATHQVIITTTEKVINLPADTKYVSIVK